ncbi:hypothetical protein FLM9_430 [Candidatus Synechococcus spongiarum]|uniref:Transposase n=1 Tax=Candidatus Synechococcus spongiarum TaxID=431041 RepID=A0A161KFE3_9SYNE|nr:hypothetical protein FLM9_430 [Candidatus Synechococcus spongiarum]
MTIIKDCVGRYFASFMVEVEHPELPPNGKAIGVDLGLTAFATTNNNPNSG